MINAIFGVLDIGRVRNFSDLAADEKTLEVICRFQEIHTEFPAAELDEKGIIPEAAMKRLRQIGFFGLNIPAAYGGGLTVFAQMEPSTPGFMGAFIVDTGWQGVIIGKDMPKMGLKASSTATIQFKNVHVPRENLLGKPGDGFKI
ncbi:MAG: acyl-CoA dehydrogenase family protein, partial [Desulfobacterales bacterium]